MAFADPLKQVCKTLFCLDDNHFNNAFMKESVVPYWGKSPRQMMQFVGTELIRNQLDPEFWIKHAKLRVETSDNKNIVFSDVRFLNEAAFVKSLGGKLVRIQRQWDFGGQEDKHQTEVEQNDIKVDTIIVNQYENFQELYSKVESVLHSEN